MPIRIDEVHADVTVIDGELPLTERQLTKLAQLVASRLEAERMRCAERAIETGVVPASPVRDTR